MLALGLSCGACRAPKCPTGFWIWESFRLLVRLVGRRSVLTDMRVLLAGLLGLLGWLRRL